MWGLIKIVQKLIGKKATIVSSMGRIDKGNTHKIWGWNLATAEVNILILLVLMTAALGFFFTELLSNHWITKELLYSINNSSYQFITIWQTGQFLILIVGVLYYLIYRGARKNRQDFVEYLSSNFCYLKNFSLFSDLFLKFCVFSLLLLTNKPELISPIFFLFIADYLFRRRLFTVPTKISIISGLLFVCFAFIQFWKGSPLISWSLMGYIVISSISLIYAFKQRNTIRRMLIQEA